MEVLVRQSGK